jgi:hypothetical protein
MSCSAADGGNQASAARRLHSAARCRDLAGVGQQAPRGERPAAGRSLRWRGCLRRCSATIARRPCTTSSRDAGHQHKGARPIWVLNLPTSGRTIFAQRPRLASASWGCCRSDSCGSQAALLHGGRCNRAAFAGALGDELGVFRGRVAGWRSCVRENQAWRSNWSCGRHLCGPARVATIDADFHARRPLADPLAEVDGKRRRQRQRRMDGGQFSVIATFVFLASYLRFPGCRTARPRRAFGLQPAPPRPFAGQVPESRDRCTRPAIWPAGQRRAR